MPRHALGDKPMTDAERQRKRRERLRQERGQVDPSPTAIIDGLRKENAELRRQLAAGPTDDQSLTKARAEIVRLQERIRRLEAALAAHKSPDADAVKPKPAQPHASREEQFNGTVTPAKFAAVLARATSANDSEALTSLRKAQAMLRASGHDWHAVVEAVGRTELFRPSNTGQLSHVRSSATSTLRLRRYMSESEHQFLQQLADDPASHPYRAAMDRLRIILVAAEAKRRAEAKARRAARGP